jgi:hypothetical protein
MDDFYPYFAGYAFLPSTENIYMFKFVDKIECIKNNEIKDSLIKSAGLNTQCTSNICTDSNFWELVLDQITLPKCSIFTNMHMYYGQRRTFYCSNLDHENVVGGFFFMCNDDFDQGFMIVLFG